jgi:hypothetical protein
MQCRETKQFQPLNMKEFSIRFSAVRLRQRRRSLMVFQFFSERLVSTTAQLPRMQQSSIIANSKHFNGILQRVCFQTFSLQIFKCP